MPAKTRQNTFTRIVGATPVNILPNSPRRKSFLLSPITASPNPGTLVLTAAVFHAGEAQHWTVPAGVTQVLDMYLWSASLFAGANAPGITGTGGSGGAAISTTGPLTVVGGSIYTLNVAAAAAGGLSSIKNPAAVTIADNGNAGAGSAGAGGAGGVVGVGLTSFAGGAGAGPLLLAGAGGGGGGAAGVGAAGSAAIGSTAGAGGGVATILGYGAGGTGGGGGNPGLGAAGTAPGGGAGGADGTGGAGAAGQDGLAVIFYYAPIGVAAGGTVSMDSYSKITIGRGSMNWANGVVFPMLVDDEEVGTIVTEEWWIVADRAGVPVTITEYLYEQEQECW
jgi:hypothetical protein